MEAYWVAAREPVEEAAVRAEQAQERRKDTEARGRPRAQSEHTRDKERKADRAGTVHGKKA